MGTALHCLEDYTAHSNYTELSLIELGERDVFPHVGRNTKVQLPGARNPVYPIITGTFGGTDFLHSVMGEVADKATQSELQSLEGVFSESENEKPSESFLQQLLDKIPSEILGGDKDNTGKMDEFQANAQAQAEHQDVSPLEPEEWATYLDNVRKQIYPVMEWHDNLVKQISQAIEKLPLLPDLVEQVQNEITIFVYSIIAPYVLPILRQVKGELETGSSEVIESSREQQHIVFNDDNCTDPTHSMLAKDHFSNVLNEPAGKISMEIVRWVVPQIMECWDDESVDVDRTMTRIIYGVLHHPVHRDFGEDGSAEIRQTMFRVVTDWWEEQGDHGRETLRRQLSREGVQQGDNHKPGVADCGHGCGKPLSIPKKGKGKKSSGSGGGSGGDSDISKFAQEAMGGGVLGGIVGNIVGQSGSDFLSGAFGEEEVEKEKKEKKDKKKKSKDYDDGEDEKKYKKKSKDRDDDDKKYKKKSKDYDDEDEKKKYKKSKDYDSDDEKKYKKKSKDHEETSGYGYERNRYDDGGRQTYERSQYQETRYDDGSRRQEGYARAEHGGVSYEGYAQRDAHGQERYVVDPLLFIQLSGLH